MHREYRRMVQRAGTAVLMVHGIVGTPRHFDFLLQAVPADVTVVNLLLPGHGGTVTDFARASMKAWQTAVEEAVDDLCATHERVLLVGHSMGTLLTARASVGRPQVQGMLYLNVPLRIHLAPRMMLASLRWCFGLLRMDRFHDAALAGASGTCPDKRLWLYLAWLPRFAELLVLCRSCRPIFEGLERTAYVFQSRDDELVRRSSSRHLTDNKNIHHTMLPGCGHFAYTEPAKVQMREALRKLLETV